VGVRVTNASDCGGADCVNYVGYSYWRNTNNHVGSGTMLVVVTLDRSRGGTGPTLFSYDKQTDQVEKVGPLFDQSDPLSWATGEGWYFSATRPSALYLNQGARMLRYDVLTRQAETVFDAVAEFGAGHIIWQMHSSDDDRVHSATLKSSVTWQPLGCVVYREDTQAFSYFESGGDFDECQIDRSGRWLVIKENVDGVHGEDNRIIDVDSGMETVLLDAQGAGGHSDAGLGYMVAEDNWNAVPGAVRVWTFGQALPGSAPQGRLVYRTTDWNTNIGHVSHTNARGGVAAEQQYACGGGVNRQALPRANEIVCFPLDGSLDVLVVAPNLTDLNAAGGGDDYGKMPKGNLDVTGQYFIWTGNAGTNRLDAFIVRVPAALLDTGGGGSGGGEGGDATPPAVAVIEPAGGTTLTGAVTVSATASDNVGVAGVQFQLDGVNIGPEITAAPFTTLWNAGGTASGSYALTAVARDAAGNTTTSTAVAVTLQGTTSGVFTDDFGRPDSGVVGALWQTVQGDFAIKTAELRNGPTKGTHLAVLPWLAGATQEVSTDFTSVGNTSNPIFGVVVRYLDPENYYVMYRQAGGTSALRIARVVNGVETVLKSAKVSNPKPGTVFRLGGRANGTTLTLELNGATKLTVTDAALSSGTAGIALSAKKSGSTASQRADNFSASVQ
jgi:hypothetical protein